MEDSPVFARNPWIDDDRSLGCVKDVLFLAEKTGHIQRGQEIKKKTLEEAIFSSPSLRMMSQLKEIDTKRKEIAKVNLDIQRRLQHKETHDLTNTNVLEKRIKQINELTSHLQMVINQKDQLISRLQQPYVGDFIKMDVNYKKYAADVFPLIVPILSDLSSQLDNISWASKADVNNGRLEGILSELASALATFQSQYQSLSRLRHTIHTLYASPLHNSVLDIT